MDAIEKHARFESWAKARGLDLHRLKHTKGYRNALTADAWAAWKTASAPPQGYVLVPLQITGEMTVAFAETWFSKVRPIDDCDLQDAWDAALAARPTK